MTVATMQYPRVLSNAHEIKRYPTFKAAQTIENAVFVVAYLMAALLGGMCGIAIAVYSGSAFSVSTLFNSETARTEAAVVISHEATIADKGLPPASQAVRQESTTPASLLTVAVPKSAARESTSLIPRVLSAVYTHHATRKASARLHHSARFRRSLRHRMVEFTKTPVIAAMPQSSETAETIAVVSARPPASFMIEGDATVADYDALAGMIETQEGRTFSVAKSADESGGLPWADSLASVHYRCDQSGNCTLFHGGSSVTNVRMTNQVTGT